MKKNNWTFVLVLLSMVLMVSCGKDYNALFQERVAELTKEGKYILNQYNDSVGKDMSTWTFHRWVSLCKAGSAHTYLCQNCGIQVHTNDVPQMGACREGANHVWSQL